MAKRPKSHESTTTPGANRAKDSGFIDSLQEIDSWGQALRTISRLLTDAKGYKAKVTGLSARGVAIEFAEPVIFTPEGLAVLEFRVKEMRTLKSSGGSIKVSLTPLEKDREAHHDSSRAIEEPKTKQIVRLGDAANLEKLRASSKFRKGVSDLKRVLEANGASLDEIGKKLGIRDQRMLLRLPVVSMNSAHEFLGMTRQNVQRLANDRTLDFGTKIDGKLFFSVEELALFREIPRPTGVNRS